MPRPMSEEDEKIIAKRMEQMAGELQRKQDSFNIWKCLSCGSEQEYSFGDLLKHLSDAHNVDITKKVAGSSKMVMHLDGKGWYQTNYEVYVQDSDVRLLNLVRNKRNKRTQIY